MKHLLLSFVSLFHHPHQVAKPALNVELLNRATAQLTLSDQGDDQNKVICVYPLSSNSKKAEPTGDDKTATPKP